MRRFLILGVAIAAVWGASPTASAAIPVVKGERWEASDGRHINCHGGGIIKVDDTYYWYGESRGKGFSCNGVACYTSRDLQKWDNHGIVLPVDGGRGDLVRKGSTIERPKVIHNPLTGMYVMWFHQELPRRGYAAAFATCAVADNPLGPFRPVKTGRVNRVSCP